MAPLKAASLVFEGALNPESLRTNCSEAARISSSVAGGSKLNSVLILRHMSASIAGDCIAGVSQSPASDKSAAGFSKTRAGSTPSHIFSAKSLYERIELAVQALP